MSDRVSTSCDQCGQRDDHPKLHYGLQTFHHDCTPVPIKNVVIEGAPNSNVVAEIFHSAESGVRGNDLLAKINELHGVTSEETPNG